MHTVELKDESQTLALGQSLAKQLVAGDIVTLTGDLGAGKTTLARGCIQALTGEDQVPSPTYTLVQTYDAQGMELWHCDLYRLESPEDAFELGLMDAFEDMTLLIEWPDRLGNLLPVDHLNIEITFEGSGRLAHLSGGPSWQNRLGKINAR